MNVLATAKIGTVVGVVLVGVTIGCLGRSPAAREYTMNPVAGSAVGHGSELTVGLGPIEFPRYLERPHMVTRLAGSELAYDELHRWAGGFESNVARVLADDLSTRLGGARVVHGPSALALEYRVSVTFQQFEGRAGEDLVLRAQWVIRAAASDVSWRDETIVSQPLGSGAENLVSAHDAALGQLADAIAAAIARAETQRDP